MGQHHTGASVTTLSKSLTLALAATCGVVALGVAPQPAPAAAPSDGGAVANFYRARGGAPLWFAPRSGPAAQQLIQLLSTASADNLDPKRYNPRGLARAIDAARSGNPAAVQQAEAMLSQAFVAYVRDLKHDPRIGIVYVDQELKPTPPSAGTILAQAAAARSLPDYVQKMGWMNPMNHLIIPRLITCWHTNLSWNCTWTLRSLTCNKDIILASFLLKREFPSIICRLCSIRFMESGSMILSINIESTISLTTSANQVGTR